MQEKVFNYRKIFLDFAREADSMKRLWWVLLLLVIFSKDCLAMTFSQPIELGRIYFPLAGVKSASIKIENATYIGSKSDGTFQGDVGYSYDRLTKFGSAENDIYVHHKSRYG